MINFRLDSYGLKILMYSLLFLVIKHIERKLRTKCLVLKWKQNSYEDDDNVDDDGHDCVMLLFEYNTFRLKNRK